MTDKSVQDMSDDELLALIGKDRSSFQAKGAEIFKKQKTNIPAQLRSAAQSVAQGIALAPVELAAGATRLVSPNAADSMERGLGRFKQALNQAGDQVYGRGQGGEISPQARENLYSIGNTLPLGVGSTGLRSVLGASAGAGLQAAEEGDTRLGTLGKAGLSTAIGGGLYGTAAIVPKVIEKGFNVVKDKLSTESSKAAAAQQLANKADEIHKVMKGEVHSIYKDLGISKTKLSPAEYDAQIKFVQEFKHNLASDAAAKFDAVTPLKAPQEVIDKFATLDKSTIRLAQQTMQKSGNNLDIVALKNPDTMLYYEQLRKSLSDAGNKGFSKEAVNVMGSAVPGYKEAMNAYKSSISFNKNLGENFFNALKSSKYDSMAGSIDDVLQTSNGKEVLDKLFTNGMRKELIKNSNLTPIEQLTKTVGSDPLQQSQMIDFMRKIGKQESADKIQALASFVQATKAAQSQPNSAIGKLVGMKTSELDPAKMSAAIKNLLDSNNKFGQQFAKIMQEQVPSDTKTEKIFNLLRRAGQSVRETAAPLPGRLLFDNNKSQNTTDTGY